MQPDGRLVEHVQRAYEGRSERRRQVDALRFAPGERRGQPVESQVVEPDPAQESDPPPDLPNHPLRDGRLLRRQRKILEEPARRSHRESRDLIDRPAMDVHVTRFAPQARAAALRAGAVAAVAAQEHPHVHLVLLPLQGRKEPPDAPVAGPVPLHHEAPLRVRQLRPRHGGPDIVTAGGPFQVGEMRAIVRLAPRFDGALRDRLRLVRHDQVHVELDHVPEAVAGGAGPERAVEREQRRLGRLEGDSARTALEALAELVAHGRCAADLHRERVAAPFLVRGLDRLGQPGQRLRSGPDAVDHDLQLVPPGERGRVQIIEGDGAAVHVEPSESLATEAVERRRDHVRTTRLPDPVRTTGRRDRLRASGRSGRAVALCSHSRRVRHRRHEADQQPRPRGETGQPAGHRLRRLARHRHAAAAADRPADPGEQQPQVVVDLGCGTDRRARIPDAVLLADGDGGADAVDAVDVRLLHPLEELPGVGGQRLDVAPLPLRVHRVEGQRRFSRAAHAGNDDQALLRERQVDVLEVVGPGAPNDDLALGWLAGRLRHACHGGTGASSAPRPGRTTAYRHGDPLRPAGNRLF